MLAARPPTPGGPDDVEWDQKEMPFTEHLRELRNRLFICVVTVLALVVLLHSFCNPSYFTLRPLPTYTFSCN